MRLIDAEAFVKALCKECQEGPFACEFCLATGVLLEIPTIDAEHVRRGRWIVSEFPGLFYCSECHSMHTINADYCSDCGARMDAE